MPNTILILEIENLSKDSEVDYLKKAIPLEITHILSNFKNINFISNVNLNQLTAPLSKHVEIDFILNGTFIKINSAYRFHFQLLNKKDNHCLLSIKLQEDEKDMFKLIDKVASQIVKHLELEFTPQKQRPKITSNSYKAYLKGLHHYNLWNIENIEIAIQQFKKVIQLSPEYPPTYVRLSECFSLLAVIKSKDSVNNYNNAKTHALKAIELDKTSIDAYLSLALIKLVNDVDILGAYYAFENAFAINSSYTKCHHYYAYYLICIGKYSKAIDALEYALKSEPLNLQLNTTYGFALSLNKNYAQAEEHLKKTLMSYPNSEVSIDALIWTYILNKEYLKAKTLLENCKIKLLLSPAMQIIVYKELDDTKNLDIWLNTFESLLKKDYEGSHSKEITATYLALNQPKKALTYFEILFKNKMGLIRALTHPAWEKLRKSDKFYIYKKKLKLLNPPILPSNLTERNEGIILIRSSTSDFITLTEKNLLYIESQGIYCNIIFLDKSNTIQKKTLRTSLNKIIDDTLYLHFFRCHNSFIVNTKIPFVFTGNKKYPKLQLFSHNISIPVSRNKVSSIYKIFSPV